jgi:hypothetical protein
MARKTTTRKTKRVVKAAAAGTVVRSRETFAGTTGRPMATVNLFGAGAYTKWDRRKIAAWLQKQAAHLLDDPAPLSPKRATMILRG